MILLTTKNANDGGVLVAVGVPPGVRHREFAVAATFQVTITAFVSVNFMIVFIETIASAAYYLHYFCIYSFINRDKGSVRVIVTFDLYLLVGVTKVPVSERVPAFFIAIVRRCTFRLIAHDERHCVRPTIVWNIRGNQIIPNRSLCIPALVVVNSDWLTFETC